MGHSFTNNLYHIVFSTKKRRPVLTDEIRDRLFPYIGGVARNSGGSTILANGAEDHIHILAKIRPDVAVSQFVSKLKANSSRWLAQTFPAINWLGWQAGYGCFSVSESQAEEIMKYIRKQQSRHARMTYDREITRLLEKHKIPFDAEALAD